MNNQLEKSKPSYTVIIGLLFIAVGAILTLTAIDMGENGSLNDGMGEGMIGGILFIIGIVLFNYKKS